MPTPEDHIAAEALRFQHEELCRYHRHWDTLKWTVIGLAYPSFAALLALALTQWTWSTQPAPIVAVVWIAALWLFVSGAIYRQLHHYQLVQLERGKRIERQLNAILGLEQRSDPDGCVKWWLLNLFPADRPSRREVLRSWLWERYPKRLSIVFGWVIPFAALGVAALATTGWLSGWGVES